MMIQKLQIPTKWTKEKPTEPGFYWYRITYADDGTFDDDDIEIVKIWALSNGKLCVSFVGDECSSDLLHLMGEWGIA